MSGTGSILGLDPSLLLGYYQNQLNSSPTAIAAANRVASSTNAATANDVTPWSTPQPAQTAQDAKILSTENFLDTSNVPLVAGSTDAKVEQDNQKLFSLYSAVNNLAYLVKMGQRGTTTTGQLAGLNNRLQAGLQQVQDYISSTSFNNFSLQAAASTDNVTSTAGVSLGAFTYSTKALATNSTVDQPLSGLSTSDSFSIAVKKGSGTTNVAIDLSQVQGPLTLSNVVGYVNEQLSAAGVKTRFQKVQIGGTATSNATATYKLQITPGANETVSLSAASNPALYVVGNSGSATGFSTTTTQATTNTAADQQGRLTKLTDLDTAPTTAFSVDAAPTTGNTTAQATAVDAGGNVYVIGNATGNLDSSQINQGTQDSYLTKYDSAGNVVWQKTLGSAGTASGYGLALDPSGGVVITGATTADLTTTAVADGNNDSFVARYDANGNQTWIKQIQTLATNQSNAVSVDASGNVYIGGSVSGGVIGKGQTSLGKGDAYLAKFDSKGNLLAENQFGTSGADSVAASTTSADGSLYVASVQNGHAVVAKYANGDIASAPTWTQDLGDLSVGGAIGGIAVSNGEVYVSGTTSNSNLTAGGVARIATNPSGGTDAFVFGLTDQGTDARPDQVSYIGTSTGDKGGAVTVDANGTVYLTGTTLGTFAGQQRNVQNVANAFATALNANGSIAWMRQYGGASGQSTGASLAIDTQGSSVLDALGLPRGTISLNQSVDLTSQTSLRAGDSFQIKIDGVAPRTATIRIDAGETLSSLSTKINAQLGSLGKASVNYGNNTEGLKLQVNPGNTIELISGPADFDALARLGIPAGTLTSAAVDSKGKPIATVSSSTDTAFGLGLTNTIDMSTKTGADLARSTLLGVLSALQSAYQKTNTPAAPTTVGNTTGTASPALTSQLGSYNLALSLLSTTSDSAVSNIAQIVGGGG